MRYGIPLIAFVFAVLLYLAAPVAQSFDSRWSVLIAQSLLHEGNVNLDEYRERLDLEGRGTRFKPFLNEVGGHLVSYFPIASGVFTTPVVALYEHSDLVACYVMRRATKQASCNPLDRDVWRDKALLERMNASFLSALAVGCFAAMLGDALPMGATIVGTLLLLAGSSLLSITSRAMWPQTTTAALLGVVLLIMTSSRTRWDRSGAAVLCGILLGTAYFVRPTNLVAIICLGAFLFLEHRSKVFLFAVGLLAGAVPWLLINQSAYGQFLPEYFNPSRLSHTETFWEALGGHLFSPARGLFIFMPWILILGLCGFRRHQFKAWALLSKLCLLNILVHWVAVSRFPHWWGGYSFGPRLMLDVLPQMVVVLIECGRTVCSSKRVWRYAVGVTGILACGIHLAGAFNSATQYWNTRPISVDQAPERLWDWSDPPFLRTAGR